MAMDALDNAIATLNRARRITLGLFEDIPEDKLTHQVTPGANHALWIAGHVAWTDEFFRTTLGGRQGVLPDHWTDLFGQGSTPVPDRSSYPAFPELRSIMSDRREELCAWFKAMEPDRLACPLPDKYESFAPNYCALITTIACHETLHAGQLTVIRKSLGIAPKFG